MQRDGGAGGHWPGLGWPGGAPPSPGLSPTLYAQGRGPQALKGKANQAPDSPGVQVGHMEGPWVLWGALGAGWGAQKVLGCFGRSPEGADRPVWLLNPDPVGAGPGIPVLAWVRVGGGASLRKRPSWEPHLRALGFVTVRGAGPPSGLLHQPFLGFGYPVPRSWHRAAHRGDAGPAMPSHSPTR